MATTPLTAIWLVAGFAGRVRLCSVSPLEDTETLPNLVDGDRLRWWLERAIADHVVHHLILVGNHDDLVWLRFCLGAQICGHVLAEICCPVSEDVFTPDGQNALRMMFNKQSRM